MPKLLTKMIKHSRSTQK